MRPQDYPPPPVLILTGPPGAGKTTTARLLAERAERAVHVESDRFFDFIRSGFVEPWKRESRDSQPLADPRVVERLWHDFADLGPLARHAVDLVTEDQGAAADMIEARLRDGSLRT